MKRLMFPVIALGLSACVAPVFDPVNPDGTGAPPPPRYGLPQDEADALVMGIVAEAGCRITFDNFQSALDARGIDPAQADPTTEAGRLILANRFILESTILDMAENGQLDRSSWTFTSNTGACA